MGRNTIATKSILVEDGAPSAVQFSFSDGTLVTVRPDDFPQSIQDMLPLKGIAHTLGDSYSKTTGPLEARQQLQGRIDAWMAGDWAVRGDTATDLALALSRIGGSPLEAVIAKLADLSKADKDKLMKKQKVKLELMKIRMERMEASAGDDDEELDF